jgi:hypothetical protein
MPPLVSPAPVAGQPGTQQFAPRPGPAARVSQPALRAQKNPFQPEQPPPAQAAQPKPPKDDIDDEATIMEDSTDDGDDQIETLVLVRDKLMLPKKPS